MCARYERRSSALRLSTARRQVWGRGPNSTTHSTASLYRLTTASQSTPEVHRSKSHDRERCIAVTRYSQHVDNAEVRQEPNIKRSPCETAETFGARKILPSGTPPTLSVIPYRLVIRAASSSFTAINAGSL